MKKRLAWILGLTSLSVFFCASLTSCSIVTLVKHFQEEASNSSEGSSTESDASENHIDLKLNAERSELVLDDEESGFAQLEPAYDEETVAAIATYLSVSSVEFTYQWKTSDSSVVKVDKNGMVTATGKGEATVSVIAKIKGKTGVAGTASYDFSVEADEDYYTVSKGGSSFASNGMVVSNAGKWHFYCDQTSVINATSAYFNRNAAHFSFDNIATQKEWYIRYQPQGVASGDYYALSFTLTLDADAYIRYGGPKGYRYVEYYEAGTHEVTVDNCYFDGATPFSICVLSEMPDGVDDKSEFKNQIMGGTFSLSIADLHLEESTLTMNKTTASIDMTGNSNSVTLSATDPTSETPSFVWSSSDENIATVDDSGVVTGVGNGVAVITATNAQGRHVSCRVTVITESISLNTSTDVIDLDGEDRTLQLVATVNSVEGGEKSVSWSSSDTDIATVSPEGVVTALSEGSVVITATTGTVSATCTVTIAHSPMKFGNNATAVDSAGEWFYYYDTKAIKNNPVSIARADKENGNVTVTMGTAGKTVQLKYQPNLEAGTAYSITFTITAPEGATYSAFKYGTDGSLTDGLTEIKGGKTTFTYTGEINATNPFVISFKQDKTGDVVVSDIRVTTPAVLSATYLSFDLYTGNCSSDLTVKNYDGTIEWSSSSEAVTVENGKVTAVSVGEAVVTAKLEDGTELSCNVTVTDGTPAQGGDGESGGDTPEGTVKYTVTKGKDEEIVADVGKWYYNQSTSKVTSAEYVDGTITISYSSAASNNVLQLRYQPEKYSATETKTYTVKITILSQSEGTIKYGGTSKVSEQIEAGTEKSITTTYTLEEKKPFGIQLPASTNGNTVVVSVEFVPVQPDQPEPEQPAVTVTLDKTTAEVDLAETTTMKLQATTSDGSEVVWSSSDQTVATVENGVVTFLKTGTVTVTATSGEGSASCEITVVDTTPAQGGDGEVDNGGDTSEGKVKYTVTGGATLGKDANVVANVGTWYYYQSTDKVTSAEYADGTITISYSSATSKNVLQLRYQPEEYSATETKTYTVKITILSQSEGTIKYGGTSKESAQIEANTEQVIETTYTLEKEKSFGIQLPTTDSANTVVVSVEFIPV